MSAVTTSYPSLDLVAPIATFAIDAEPLADSATSAEGAETVALVTPWNRLERVCAAAYSNALEAAPLLLAAGAVGLMMSKLVGLI